MLLDILQQTHHLSAANVLMGHFAPAMENHGLHFVTLAEELDNLVLANLIVMLGRRGAKLHFLDLCALLVLARLMSLFVLLVEKLAEIGDFADRRHGIRRNLDQIEPRLARRLHGVEVSHHAKLIPLVIDHAQFARANAFVHPRTTTRSSSFGDKPTSSPN